MFSKSAAFYDAIYSFKDYAAEAVEVQGLIEKRNPDAGTLLDVACGTGLHLQYLAGAFDVEGIDLGAGYWRSPSSASRASLSTKVTCGPSTWGRSSMR